jgi:hypothetical protein
MAGFLGLAALIGSTGSEAWAAARGKTTDSRTDARMRWVIFGSRTTASVVRNVGYSDISIRKKLDGYQVEKTYCHHR